MLFWKIMDSLLSVTKEVVSILILLDAVLEDRLIAVKTHAVRVSILILLDAVLEAKYCSIGFLILSVSILILLDAVLEENWDCQHSTVRNVSILILLDAVLEGNSSMKKPVSLHGFNPYFVGCCSGSVEENATRSDLKKFQSLFCWMLFWKLIALINDKAVGCVFQSLFCWMLFWKTEKYYAHLLPNQSFNPYFVGCCSGSWPAPNDKTVVGLVSILILLDAVLEVESTVNAKRLYERFNPYFVGCCSGSLRCFRYGKADSLVSILILLDAVLEGHRHNIPAAGNV